MSTETILPTHIDPAINALDVAGAERIEALAGELDEAKRLYDPMRVAERFLDALSDSYQTRFWADISPIERRRMIRASQRYYRRIGTPAAVKQVLEAVEIESRLEEWWQYAADAYHFRVVLTPQNAAQVFDEAMFGRLVELIDRVKSVRSKLDGYRFELAVDERVAVQAAGVLSVKLHGTATADLEPLQSVNLAAAEAWDARLHTTGRIDMNVKSDTNIQGAAAWRV